MNVKDYCLFLPELTDEEAGVQVDAGDAVFITNSQSSEQR